MPQQEAVYTMLYFLPCPSLCNLFAMSEILIVCIVCWYSSHFEKIYCVVKKKLAQKL